MQSCSESLTSPLPPAKFSFGKTIRSKFYDLIGGSAAFENILVKFLGGQKQTKGYFCCAVAFCSMELVSASLCSCSLCKHFSFFFFIFVGIVVWVQVRQLLLVQGGNF